MGLEHHLRILSSFHDSTPLIGKLINKNHICDSASSHVGEYVCAVKVALIMQLTLYRTFCGEDIAFVIKQISAQ